jgi:hypothetical protein
MCAELELKATGKSLVTYLVQRIGVWTMLSNQKAVNYLDIDKPSYKKMQNN